MILIFTKKYDTSDTGFDSGKPKDTFCMNWLFYCTTNIEIYIDFKYMLNSGYIEVLLLMQKHDH